MSLAAVTVIRNGTIVGSENDSARLKAPLPDENGNYIIQFDGELISIDQGDFYVVRDSDLALVIAKSTEIIIKSV